MIGPLKWLVSFSAATVEIRLPRAIRRDTGHALRFANIADRDHGLAGAGGEHQVNVFGLDKCESYFAATFAVRLAVCFQNLHRMVHAINRQAVGNNFADMRHDELIALAKAFERSGGGRDKSDLQNAPAAARRLAHQQVRCGQGRQAGNG